MAHRKTSKYATELRKRKKHKKSGQLCLKKNGVHHSDNLKHLYIIGNGFDIHHKISSRYAHFRQWLEENDIVTLYKIEEILKAVDYKWWNEFEKNLGSPSAVRNYAEQVAFENQPNYASDDYRDRDLYVAEYEVERELGSLMNDLKSYFREWASQLPAGDKLLTSETYKSL